jgi:hypothetical protein
LFQHGGEREILSSKDNAPGLDSAHIQNIVDECQQMPGAVTGFFEVFTRLGGERFVVQCKVIKNYSRTPETLYTCRISGIEI